MDTFSEHMEIYRSEHRTLGCKVTHMIGVPLIAASLPTAFFNFPAAAGMFGAGWVLQVTGHYVFEKNKPVLFADPTNPMTYIAAITFVGEEWGKVLTGKPLVEMRTK